jgi:hypothetical protein
MRLFFLITAIFFTNKILTAQQIATCKKYDSTILSEKEFSIVWEKNAVILIDCDGKKHKLNKFRAIAQVYPYSQFYQLLIGQKLKWLNKQGIFLDTIPKEYFSRHVCGTVCKSYNSILVRNDSTFIHYIITCPDEEFKPVNEFKYAPVGGRLTFLNGDSNFATRGYDRFAKELESNLYFEKMTTGKINIVKIDYAAGSLSKTFIEKGYDSVCKMAPFILDIVYQPFRFIKEGKYGYYPIMKEGKYKMLLDFEYNFARFTMPNGKRGWLDKTGKEYFD